MILRSKLSIMGLYYADNTIFDNMVLPENVDRETLIADILSECAELEVLYPDSDYMKMIIGYWSNKMLPSWDKINEALNLEYDPINNYKKHTTHKGKDTNTSINSVKAYNEQNNFVDYQKDHDDNNKEFERDVIGNVGIRSYQALLGEEIEMRKNYNIYDIILNDFKRRFLLLVY